MPWGEIAVVVTAYLAGGGTTAFLFGRYVDDLDGIGWMPVIWPITLPLLLFYICYQFGRDS